MPADAASHHGGVSGARSREYAWIGRTRIRLRQAQTADWRRDRTDLCHLERLLHQIVEAATGLTDSEMAGILLFDEHSGESRHLRVEFPLFTPATAVSGGAGDRVFFWEDCNVRSDSDWR